MKKPLAAIVSILTNNVLSIKRALEFIGFEANKDKLLMSMKRIDQNNER